MKIACWWFLWPRWRRKWHYVDDKGTRSLCGTPIPTREGMEPDHPQLAPADHPPPCGKLCGECLKIYMEGARNMPLDFVREMAGFQRASAPSIGKRWRCYGCQWETEAVIGDLGHFCCGGCGFALLRPVET